MLDKCPKCKSKNYEILYACHLNSMYDDLLECQDCKEKFDCYQGEYKWTRYKERNKEEKELGRF